MSFPSRKAKPIHRISSETPSRGDNGNWEKSVRLPLIWLSYKIRMKIIKFDSLKVKYFLWVFLPIKAFVQWNIQRRQWIGTANPRKSHIQCRPCELKMGMWLKSADKKLNKGRRGKCTIKANKYQQMKKPSKTKLHFIWSFPHTLSYTRNACFGFELLFFLVAHKIKKENSKIRCQTSKKLIYICSRLLYEFSFKQRQIGCSIACCFSVVDRQLQS